MSGAGMGAAPNAEAGAAGSLDNAGGAGGQSPEDIAAKRGWKPEADYTGPKEKWVSAEEFLRRGEDEPGLLKANLKRLEAKLEDQAKTIRDFASHYSTVEQKAYERAVKDLEARQADAVAAGDVAGVKAITREMTQLATEAKKAPAVAAATGDPVGDFKARNTWYGANDVMTAWASGRSSQLAEQGLNTDQQLKRIETEAREKFPDVFENKRRDEPSPVDTSGAQRRGQGAKSFNDLPAEAKAACDRFVKTIPGLTREKYVKDYFG